MSYLNPRSFSTKKDQAIRQPRLLPRTVTKLCETTTLRLAVATLMPYPKFRRDLEPPHLAGTQCQGWYRCHFWCSGRASGSRCSVLLTLRRSGSPAEVHLHAVCAWGRWCHAGIVSRTTRTPARLDRTGQSRLLADNHHKYRGNITDHAVSYTHSVQEEPIVGAHGTAVIAQCSAEKRENR